MDQLAPKDLNLWFYQQLILDYPETPGLNYCGSIDLMWMQVRYFCDKYEYKKAGIMAWLSDSFCYAVAPLADTDRPRTIEEVSHRMGLILKDAIEEMRKRVEP